MVGLVSSIVGPRYSERARSLRLSLAGCKYEIDTILLQLLVSFASPLALSPVPGLVVRALVLGIANEIPAVAFLVFLWSFIRKKPSHNILGIRRFHSFTTCTDPRLATCSCVTWCATQTRLIPLCRFWIAFCFSCSIPYREEGCCVLPRPL